MGIYSNETPTQIECHRVNGRFPSWSWDQPPGIGILRGEGRCGQTSVANLLANTSPARRISPARIARMGGDLAPGSAPATLLGHLRELSGPGRRHQLSTRDPQGLSGASPARPIACLLQWESLSLHWVTVVGRDAQSVYFNHWGTQQSLTRGVFLARWGFRDQGIVDSAIASLGRIEPYTALR